MGLFRPGYPDNRPTANDSTMPSPVIFHIGHSVRPTSSALTCAQSGSVLVSKDGSVFLSGSARHRDPEQSWQCGCLSVHPCGWETAIPGYDVQTKNGAAFPRLYPVTAQTGLYLYPRASHPGGLILYHAAVGLRADAFNYISLESALSDAGVISQIPMNCVSC